MKKTVIEQNEGLTIEVQKLGNSVFISQKYEDGGDEECVDVYSQYATQLALAIDPNFAIGFKKWIDKNQFEIDTRAQRCHTDAEYLEIYIEHLNKQK